MWNRNPRWLGLVAAPPRFGARLVIGRPGSVDFRVTTRVVRLFSRADGVLIETASGSRYLLGPYGHIYEVEVIDGETRESDAA